MVLPKRKFAGTDQPANINLKSLKFKYDVKNRHGCIYAADATTGSLSCCSAALAKAFMKFLQITWSTGFRSGMFSCNCSELMSLLTAATSLGMESKEVAGHGMNDWHEEGDPSKGGSC